MKPKKNLRQLLESSVVYRTVSGFNSLNDGSYDAGKPRVIVFSKACYSEQELWLPITNSIELKRFLWKKYPSKLGFFHVIGEQQNAKRRVSLYRLTVDIPAHTSVWLPETLLLGESVEKNEVKEFNTPGGTVFIARTGTGKCSSGVPSILLPNALRFAWSVGLSDEFKATNISSQLTNQILKNSLKKVLLTKGYQLISFRRGQKLGLNIKPVSVAVAAFVPVYLLLSSSYLMIEEYRVNSSIAEKQGNVEKVIEQKQQLSLLKNENAGLEQVLKQKIDQAKYWKLLLSIETEYQAELEKISWDQKGINIAGRTKANPTKILEVVSNHPGVASAEFSAPTRRRGAFANYRIRATFVDGAKNDK